MSKQRNPAPLMQYRDTSLQYRCLPYGKLQTITREDLLSAPVQGVLIVTESPHGDADASVRSATVRDVISLFGKVNASLRRETKSPFRDPERARAAQLKSVESRRSNRRPEQHPESESGGSEKSSEKSP